MNQTTIPEFMEQQRVWWQEHCAHCSTEAERPSFEEWLAAGWQESNHALKALDAYLQKHGTYDVLEAAAQAVDTQSGGIEAWCDLMGTKCCAEMALAACEPAQMERKAVTA